ncbi:MAG: exonuclease SbcCD subunit D C-terminal domain-containing protein [Saprospiraceae bacterium]
MRLLHTSDWHLGQRFINQERIQEHELALDWLLKTIKNQQVDVLVVSGDIFDTFNPSNSAQQLYYNFLVKLSTTNCQYTIITGGNHDSPSMLEAPKALLEVLKIHVVGAAPRNNEDAVFSLKGKDGEDIAIVAAIPFLRDRDLVFAYEGESGVDRVDKIRNAIKNHFESVGEICSSVKQNNVPVIGTGHLFAFGAQTAEKQNNIYIGDEANIRIEDIPSVFDYVALGHIHRPQAIGGKENVRYSGSIIPLDFSEVADPKEVVLVDFEGDQIKSLERIPIPTFRRLKSFSGSIEQLYQRMEAFSSKHKEELTPWIELIVEDEAIPIDIDKEFRTFAEGLHLDILRVRISRQKVEDFKLSSIHQNLSDLDILDVFKQKCERASLPEEQQKEMESLFLEARDLLNQTEEED